MESKFKPDSRPGEVSFYMEAAFVIVIAVSLLLVKGLGILNFDDAWWDITVFIFIAGIAGLIFGLYAIYRKKDRTPAVLISTLVGAAAVLYIIFHSLFISG